ncbi:MAG: hypothetical protein Q4P36_04885 [Bowdeniella nasicola]|nr:hypothetical protein [Bowdeniella nasicola]
MLNQTHDGVDGAVWPFKMVIGGAAFASGWSLVALGVVPLIERFPWVLYVVMSVPTALILWALIGCYQLVGQLARHWKHARNAKDILERTARASERATDKDAGGSFSE